MLKKHIGKKKEKRKNTGDKCEQKASQCTRALKLKIGPKDTKAHL